jgi:hypothetical protein
MKKYHFNSLSAFYQACEKCTPTGEKDRFNMHTNYNRSAFTGLPLADIKKYKMSYPVGVEKLRHLADFKVEKDTKIRYYDSFDGYDIDIDRMYQGLDFLLNQRKVRKLPKTIDVFVNVSESADVDYELMLNKTWAALKVIDHLETLGVRTALYACISVNPKFTTRKRRVPLYIEVEVKNYAQSVNLGALCTAISPWMLRYWGFLFMLGRYQNLSPGLGTAENLPFTEIPKNAITIDNGQCLTTNRANNFLSNLKLAS